MEQAEKDKLLEAIHSLKKTHTWFAALGGVSRGEYITLHTIYHLMESADESESGTKITDLSKAVQMSKPAVSQMLNSLEKKGLIERVMAKSDRRVVYVKLTEPGEKQLEKTHQQFHSWFDQIIEELGAADTAELVRLINKLHTITEHLQEHN
jgi:DNA-binding MarR family transcriptional regulator